MCLFGCQFSEWTRNETNYYVMEVHELQKERVSVSVWIVLGRRAKACYPLRIEWENIDLRPNSGKSSSISNQRQFRPLVLANFLPVLASIR